MVLGIPINEAIVWSKSAIRNHELPSLTADMVSSVLAVEDVGRMS
jgi:hypothetical protein